MSYMVPPGLYAVGNPDAEAPVVVTANYKMSYDLVRQALAGRSAWLLVLETFGINVWCAAGKGSFGTDEVVRRVGAVSLSRVVSHRTLFLPVLGAPGVAAHEVTRRTGFSVRYATIRASDLPAFLDNGFVTTPAMRELTFSLRERLILVPVELVSAVKASAIIAVVLLGLGFVAAGPAAGALAAAAYLGAMLTGTVAVPVLLPWLPGRSFAAKGAVAGLLYAVFLRFAIGGGWCTAATVAASLALPAVASFFGLNFTGSTPFTSRSGVKKEMRISMPAMAAAIGVALLVLGANLAGVVK